MIDRSDETRHRSESKFHALCVTAATTAALRHGHASPGAAAVASEPFVDLHKGGIGGGLGTNARFVDDEKKFRFCPYRIE